MIPEEAKHFQKDDVYAQQRSITKSEKIITKRYGFRSGWPVLLRLNSNKTSFQNVNHAFYIQVIFISLLLLFLWRRQFFYWNNFIYKYFTWSVIINFNYNIIFLGLCLPTLGFEHSSLYRFDIIQKHIHDHVGDNLFSTLQRLYCSSNAAIFV